MIEAWSRFLLLPSDLRSSPIPALVIFYIFVFFCLELRFFKFKTKIKMKTSLSDFFARILFSLTLIWNQENTVYLLYYFSIFNLTKSMRKLYIFFLNNKSPKIHSMLHISL